MSIPPRGDGRFDYVIEKPGAEHVFELAFFNSTTTKIESERLMQIKTLIPLDCILIDLLECYNRPNLRK